jgi:hypothetical protein
VEYRGSVVRSSHPFCQLLIFGPVLDSIEQVLALNPPTLHVEIFSAGGHSRACLGKTLVDNVGKKLAFYRR